jgi:5-methylcytosine-specific restriction protein A
MSLAIFQNAESAYLRWLSEHSGGYVLNANSSPSAKYLVLHTAKCALISKRKIRAHPNCFTGEGYLKVCGENLSDLDVWMLEQGFQSFTKKCKVCNPANEKFYRRFNWTRDELILALNLYHSTPSARNKVNHPSILELSKTLRDFPYPLVDTRPPNFRNPNSVLMKMGNFSVYDPESTGAGLPQGAKLEKEVWNEFSGDIEKLARISQLIRDSYSFLTSLGGTYVLEEEGVSEGGVIYAMHKRYERDNMIVKKKKASVFAEKMALKCEVCEFDFAEVYGQLGSEFAECHHTKPVAMMKPGEKTKLNDLSIVCANCHRMLHRDRNLLSIKSLKSLITKEQDSQAIRNSFK